MSDRPNWVGAILKSSTALIAVLALVAGAAPLAASPIRPLPPALLQYSGSDAASPDQDFAAAQDDEEPELDYVEGRLLVGFRPGTSGDAKAAIHERYGAQVIREIPELGVQVLSFEGGANELTLVTAYQSQQGVAFAEPDYYATVMGAPDEDWIDPLVDAIRPMSPQSALALLALPNDPYFGRQWHLATIDSPRAWNVTRGAGTVVAIVDTGVNCAHQDLGSKCVAGYDYVNNDNDPNDDHGHGTHVAGVAAAATNNGTGVAGVGWDVRIMPMKALNRTGNGSHSAIANSITWATDQGAEVINLSLGGFFTSSTLRRAVEYAIDAGVVVVAAAGNENTSNPSYPASYDNVIGVAATTQSDQRASFSNYGTYVDVSAPGVGILSTVRNGGYQAWSGTSMAAPVVAGAASLLVAQNPSRTPQQVETLLEQTAEDLGERGWDPLFGWGRIDVGRAVNQQPGTVTPPTLEPVNPTPPVLGTATPSSDWVLQVEELINLERSRQGLPTLYTSPALRQASARHSDDMAENSFCTHDGSDGSTAYERMRDAGYMHPYSEIIGCGQVSPAMVVEAWMNSPAHRAIILCTPCTQHGAGYRNISRGARHYWTVKFGTGPVSGPRPTVAQPGEPDPGPTVTPTQLPPPTPTPIQPPGRQDLIITPVNNRVGWVVSSQPSLNHFGDENTYTGTWNGRTYHGAAQFGLANIPRDAVVHSARIEIVGRSREFLGSVGTWSVNLLRTEIDQSFPNEGYTGIHNSAIDATLLPLLGTNDLDEGRVNTFVFSATQLEILRSRRSGSGWLSIRMDGPTSGSFSNLFTWDTGHGSDTRWPGPRLVVTVGEDAAPLPPTATEIPLPSDTPVPTATGPTATPEPPTETPLPPTATYTAPPPPASATPVPSRTPTPTQMPADTPLIILPMKGDVGYVRQFEAFNHFGDDNTFTGFYQTRAYHGAMQFDLGAIPPGSTIRRARLTLTGQTMRYLSSAGNGLWSVKILAANQDNGWRSSTYASLHGAPISSQLVPALRQADFGIGVENSFDFADIQLRELAFRAGTTGKISFRIDGPSTGLSNIMDWDSGYGPGRRYPPRLEVLVGPPGSAEPVPTKSPEDQARITAVINAINLKRLEAGLLPLQVSSLLGQAAAGHNDDMVRNRFFSHTGSDGSSPEDRVTRTGFNASHVLEVLAAANGDPQTVVEAWMNQGQSDQILDPTVTEIGAHYLFSATSPYRHYWTVKMARPR